MPANYKPRGGGTGRYYNNNNHFGNQRHTQQPPSIKSEPAKSPSKPANPGFPSRAQRTPPTNKTPNRPGNHSVGQAKQEPPSYTTNLHVVESENVEVTKSVEKRFTQRSRLFVGNMPTDMTEEQFKELFMKYGEISETFINAGKGFGFVRLDTRANAEKAKLELNGHMIKNRPLRVRFASHGAALSLKHLSPYVSNELLETAFAQFGPVERAVVIVDDRGRSTGRGIVEFARKSSATKALSQIADGCFLLTSSPQAIVAKPLDQEDTEDGLSEKNIHKNPQYYQEREAPPRFALPGTFEYEFAMRWKALDEMERQQQEQLNKTISTAREKLESEMENAIHEHKTMMMKQELLRRQEELNRIEEQRKMDLERRKQLEYEREDQHQKELEALAKRQEILRAQVEGTYSTSGDSNSQRNSRPGHGGFGGPPPMIRDSTADFMGSGQGGLGPAPSRQARFDPGMGPPGRAFPPPPGPPPFPGQGFSSAQRRGFPGNPMDFDHGQKRRRF